jgi:hypothetical protein
MTSNTASSLTPDLDPPLSTQPGDGSASSSEPFYPVFTPNFGTEYMITKQIPTGHELDVFVIYDVIYYVSKIVNRRGPTTVDQEYLCSLDVLKFAEDGGMKWKHLPDEEMMWFKRRDLDGRRMRQKANQFDRDLEVAPRIAGREVAE